MEDLELDFTLPGYADIELKVSEGEGEGGLLRVTVAIPGSYTAKRLQSPFTTWMSTCG